MLNASPIGTVVDFDIAQGLDVGRGVILEVEFDPDDNHPFYRLGVSSGSLAIIHRNRLGELWVNHYEVQ